MWVICSIIVGFSCLKLTMILIPAWATVIGACFFAIHLQVAFQSKTAYQGTGHIDTCFYFCGLDFAPMTLIYEFDLDILNIYLYTKN